MKTQTTCFNKENSKIYTNSDNKKYILKNTPFTKIDYIPNAPSLDYCELELSYYNAFTKESVNMSLKSKDFTSGDSTWHTIAYSKKI